MWTTALAYLILFMGFITFAGGAFGILFLMFDDLVRAGRVPLRYYAMMLALTSGGISMMGMAQGLRLLLLHCSLAGVDSATSSSFAHAFHCFQLASNSGLCHLQ